MDQEAGWWLVFFGVFWGFCVCCVCCLCNVGVFGLCHEQEAACEKSVGSLGVRRKLVRGLMSQSGQKMSDRHASGLYPISSCFWRHSITLDHGSAPGTDEGALRGRNHSFKSSSRRRQSRGSVQDSAYSPSYTWPRMTWRLENVMSDLSGRSQLIMMDVFHTRPHFHKSANSEMVRPIFYNGRLEISMVSLSKDMIAKFVRFC